MLKVSWIELGRGICAAIQVSIQAILILVLTSCLVGSWIQSGVVATVIYYGLDIINPHYFYCAAS